MTIADNLTALANQKLSYQDSVEACKVSLINKDVVVPVDAKLADISGLIDEIQQGGGDPSIPVGTGQHLVTFYDFDGKVLKRQRVNTGEDATAPETPIHQYLTFAEWNNPFTNVQSDIDTGAIYNTTDGKTYLFITLTPVTGLAPTLYFSKSSTSLMTIDWGDGTTSTSTTAGNQNIQHTYATAGDYIITVDNSQGGTWSVGQGNSYPSSTMDYKCITKVLMGNFSYLSGGNIWVDQPISIISLRSGLTFTSYSFTDIKFAKHINIPSTAGNPSYNFYNSIGLVKIIRLNNDTTVGDAVYYNCRNLLKYTAENTVTTIAGTTNWVGCINIRTFIFKSTTPPTLANINAFAGINPICKIYVPDASVEAYKTATNWITYANYIYPLSQKPQSNE
jgi:hypothetical protein